MASTGIRSARLWAESSFGDLGADGLPDRTPAATASAFDCTRASITMSGEAEKVERDDVRSSFAGVPDEVTTVLDDEGVPVHRTGGDVTLEWRMRDLGTATAADVSFIKAVASGFNTLSDPAARFVTLTGDASSQQFTIADADTGLAPTGGLLAAPRAQGAIASFCTVVAKSSNAGTTTVSYSPELETPPEESGTLRTVKAFGVLPGRALGPSVGGRSDGHGVRWYWHGGRLRTFSLSGDARQVVASATIAAALIQPAHDEVSESNPSNIDARPARPTASRPIVTLECEAVMTSPIEESETAPRAEDRIVLAVDEWSVTLENVLAPVPAWGSILGMSDMDRVGLNCSISLTLATPLSAVELDALKRNHRTLMLAYGPAPGFGMVIPAAYLTNNPAGRDLSGERVRQVLEFAAGIPLTETATAAELAANPRDDLANSPVRFGWALA